MDRLPVLYLDLDDTVIRWEDGSPSAAPGATEFVRWALEHLEVRWLTTWCPSGEMGASLLNDLARMLELPAETLTRVRGGDWSDTGSKLNAVAWLDHVVLGRPFIWIEDEYGFGGRERAFLDEAGLAGCYLHCNVSRDAEALRRAHSRLREWLADRRAA